MGTVLLRGRSLLAAGILLSAAGCQTTTGKPAPVAASAPTHTKGDSYTFAVVKSSSGPSEYVRKFDGVREGKFIFLDANNKISATYTKDGNMVSRGSRRYLPHSGMLRFPMNVGNSWVHAYTVEEGNAAYDRERRCSVNAWEDVKVLAGTFRAFRISCDNRLSGAARPADEKYWYAPAAKSIVKYESGEWYYENQLKELRISK